MTGRCLQQPGLNAATSPSRPPAGLTPVERLDACAWEGARLANFADIRDCVEFVRGYKDAVAGIALEDSTPAAAEGYAAGQAYAERILAHAVTALLDLQVVLLARAA